MSKVTFEKIDERFSDDELAAEISAFSRQYRAEGFPNPAREGCPDAAVLRKTVEAGELPESKLAEHLIACSECFQDFQKLRFNDAAGAARTARKKPRSIWFLLPATAVIAAVFVLFFVLRSDPPELAQAVSNVMEDSSRPDVPVGPASEVKEDIPVAAPAKIQKLRDPKRNLAEKPEVSARVFSFDLAASQLTRGNSDAETPSVLPASRVLVRIRLIDNSPPGRYRLSILDSEAVSAVDPQIVKSDGKTVAAEFDLTKVRGKLRLCAAPDGEIPDCIPVVVRNSR